MCAHCPQLSVLPPVTAPLMTTIQTHTDAYTSDTGWQDSLWQQANCSCNAWPESCRTLPVLPAEQSGKTVLSTRAHAMATLIAPCTLTWGAHRIVGDAYQAACVCCSTPPIGGGTNVLSICTLSCTRMCWGGCGIPSEPHST